MGSSQDILNPYLRSIDQIVCKLYALDRLRTANEQKGHYPVQSTNSIDLLYIIVQRIHVSI